MDALKAIKTRRSVRQYSSKQVDAKLIEKIIEAGKSAPSSKNTQPWHFIVLKGKKKDKVVGIVEKEFPKRKSIYRKGKVEKPTTRSSCVLTRVAPVLILVFNKAPYTHGENNVIKDCCPESLLAWTVEVESVSAAIENMLLAIHALGLGGVWLADFNFAR
ncbi:MAG: nitroreductase family protein, partial [Candidatus Diapherotrites archaeon]